MMRRIASVMVAAASLVAPTSSQAVVGCQGKVLHIEVRSDGRVNADWGWGFRQLCYLTQDVSAPSFVIKKEACTALYSQLLTAQATGQVLTSYHSNSSTCAQALAVTGDSMPTEQPYGYMIG